MGLTLATLHLRQDVPELARLVKDGEIIRRHNPPWITILSGDEPDYGCSRLRSLAKKLPCPCLLFYWYDDDEFWLELFSEGKRIAQFSSQDGQSKKVPLISAVMLGDDSATPALKLAAKFGMLNEQLKLVEEALGLSLMQLPGEEPAAVVRGCRLYDEIAQKKAKLKKRKNLFDTILCDESDVPASILEKERKHKQECLQGLSTSSVKSFQFDGVDTAGKELSVKLVVCPGRAVLHFPDGDFVDRAACSGGKSIGGAVRMNAEGNVRWITFPDTGFFDAGVYPSASSDKVLMYCCSLKDGEDCHLLELSTETGHVLQKVPLTYRATDDILWFDCLQRYVYYHSAGAENCFILLDRELKLVKKLPVASKDCHFYGMHHNDTVFWCQGERNVYTFDITNGILRTIIPEDRMLLSFISPEGLLIGSQSEKDLLIFDENGRQIYRHRFKGGADTRVENGYIYVLDRDIETDESGFRAVSWTTRIWRLEKISK